MPRLYNTENGSSLLQRKLAENWRRRFNCLWMQKLADEKLKDLLEVSGEGLAESSSRISGKPEVTLSCCYQGNGIIEQECAGTVSIHN